MEVSNQHPTPLNYHVVRLWSLLVTVALLWGCGLQSPNPSVSGTVSKRETTDRAAQFIVRSARYELTLPRADRLLQVEVGLSLQWPKGETSEGRLEVLLPPGVSEAPRLEEGCEINVLPTQRALDRRARAELKCLRVSGEEELVVTARYQVSLDQLSSYLELDEGERRYGLVVIPPKVWPELFLGADPSRKITRHVSVVSPVKESLEGGPQERELLSREALLNANSHRARLGRDVGEPVLLEESASQGLSWSWTREGALVEPLIITLGDWEPPRRLEKTNGWSATLFAPLGSAHHELMGQPFAAQQLGLIEEAITALSEFTNERGDPLLPASRVWCLTLPHASGDLKVNLARWGVIMLPEAWFYRHRVRAQSQPPSERALLYRLLIQSALKSELGPWREGLSSWIARRLSEPSEEVARSLAQQESLQRTILLDPSLESSTAQSPARVELLLDMVDGWLRARPAPPSVEGQERSDQLSLIELIKVLTVDEKAVPRHVSERAPAFEGRLTKLFASEEAPLVNVEWSWEAGSLTVRVSSDREVIPPMCLKVGIKQQPPSTLCIKPSRVVGGAASEHTVTLAAEVEWVHPNLEQRGFYRWSLNEPSFEALLKAKALHESEWGTLPEVTSQLMALGQLPPHVFLSAIDTLALRSLTPASLSLLLNYLSRAVHELGSESKQDNMRRWASSLLQGVMYSEERFQAPPISHLINLQLAEWEPLDKTFVKTALTVKERKQIDQILTSNSSADMIAGSTNRAGVEQIQYPLLLKARAGTEELWQQLAQVFAVSEDEPVSRLVALQALAAFPPPILEKTLALLTPSEEPSAEEVSSSAVASTSSAQGEGGGIEAKGAEEAGGAVDAKDESEEEEEEPVEPSLKPDEALTLILAVRSLDNRRFAWRWLKEQLSEVKSGRLSEVKLLGIEEVAVQRALLQWGAASCDQAGLDLLKAITSGALGFSQSMLRSARVAQAQAERCLTLQKGREDVERWLKQRLK